ncbi:response regulator transcription factor [Actinomyces succiniciruminis]|uniref:Response regulator protein GraR n=1 Tax=Actinomyces succiniciruminis TaxID=1522002 RepID=A0A1L7REP1_9ACTO|nr:response regulator transcription factor [Actinomyces succiniciruminis]CED92541.1 Response regulator protein GraR [Actinomyces succiniciruminis]
MYRVLVAEDDAALARGIIGLLERYQYDCTAASNFGNLLHEVERVDPDVVLLDVNLPRYDGFYWCRRIREVSKIPIIIVSARDATGDQVRGIEAGADDYLTKPFDPELLLAKVGGVIRRAYGDLSSADAEDALTVRDLILFPGRQLAAIGGQEVELSLTEAKLLQALMQAHPDAASRDRLVASAWEDAAYVEDNTLTVNIRRLRGRLSGHRVEVELRAVRGYGYRLVVGADERGGGTT